MGELAGCLFSELIGGILVAFVRVFATLGVMLAHRCDWQTATMRLDDWNRRLNERTTPHSRGIVLLMIGGGIILTAAILVAMAMVFFR